jgi:hypothetical protein
MFDDLGLYHLLLKGHVLLVLPIEREGCIDDVTVDKINPSV